VLARNIHEGFYYSRRYPATTSLTARGLAAQSVNILFQVCLLPSQLCAPVSHVVSAVSSRTLVNNAGWPAVVTMFCPARALRTRVSASGPQQNNRSIADMAGMNGS
jgi:hypothetical protein